MRTPIKNWEAGLFVITLLACLLVVAFLYQAQKQGLQEQEFINLGLDLRGGVDLTYQVDPPPGQTEVTPEMMAATQDILHKRIDPEGVKEIVVQAIGTNRLAV
ncbi:MAG TPA: hypothetical protein VEI97_12015, partial [bacterium]|nr:hypothetical protein [bacterium]